LSDPPAGGRNWC